MKTAASRTGGYFTQINPDEPVAWRAFDLYSTLNTPRLLGISVNDQAERATFLCHEDSIAHGEELCAITRLGAGEALPAKLIVTGSLDGEPFRREIAVEQVANQAEYLPRTWAKLRIDQLLAEDPARHQAEIVALSKAMYVMSPFTSLLVLETEQMYVQFGVDRGRKDHWAMYACPPQIPVVFEPETRNQPDTQAAQLAARQAGPAKSDNGVVLPIHPRFLMPSGETHQPSPFGNYFHFWVQPSNQETNTGYFMSRGFTTLGVSPSQQNEFLLYDAADWMRDGALDMDGYFSRVSDFEDRFGQVDALFGYARPQTAGSDFLDRYELAFLPDGQRRLGGYGTAFRWGAQAPRNWARDFSVLEAREFAGGAWRRLEVLQESERLELLEQRTRRRNLGRLLQGRGAQNLWYDSNGNWEETEFAPVAFGSVDSKTLEELGVVILRGSPQDVRAMREVVSQLERVSGTGDGRGWPYMNTWLGRPWRESDGDRPAARADDEMYGKALGGIAREKFLVDHLYDLVAKKERAEPLAKRKLRLAEMLLTGKSAAGLGGDHVPDRLFDFHSQALLYKPPTFSGDMRVFNDLLAYAPGMSTTLRDVQSILDQAKRDSDEIQQEIDPRARALFEKSRSGGWQAITLVSGSDEQPSRFLCDGQGRFSFERTTPEGLHEKVLCDGTVLWHVYPELGVGAKRTVGRFDRARLASMVPWLLPPLEDFTRGANVEVMDDVTLAFVPRDVAKVGREGVADDQDESRKYPRLELKFATDGRLTDRRWLEMPGRTLLIREHYAADGTVHERSGGLDDAAAQSRAGVSIGRPAARRAVRTME
jgi:hypothetical protein